MLDLFMASLKHLTIDSAIEFLQLLLGVEAFSVICWDCSAFLSSVMSLFASVSVSASFSSCLIGRKLDAESQ